MDTAGIYVHIPYCRSRCLYCDFYSEGSRRADWPRYVDALLAELRWKLREHASRGKEYEIATIYIGGGTPSQMPAEEFTRLANGLTACAGAHLREFTIEVNPDDVTDEMARIWRDSGVNRVSMGVQSMVDAELRAIGRRHDPATARRAYETLGPYFDNISLDIIFGLPYQTPETLNQTIDSMLAMRPEHISAYSLMYEERSALTKLRDSGRMQETDEDITVGMFRTVSRRFAEAGYEQYEISNYARPGYRSQHNSAYWAGFPYIGLGAGAHSYDGDRCRTSCVPDAKHYTRLWNDSNADVHDIARQLYNYEFLSDTELREEMVMTRLRTREGLDLSRYGVERDVEELLRKAASYLKSGLLELRDGMLSLTRDGIMVSDEIIADLF